MLPQKRLSEFTYGIYKKPKINNEQNNFEALYESPSSSRPTPTPSTSSFRMHYPNQILTPRVPNMESSLVYNNTPPTHQVRPRSFVNNPSMVSPSLSSMRLPSFSRFHASNLQPARELLVGSVEKVLLWSKLVKGQTILFDVFGVIDYVRNGAWATEKTFNLRDPNGGAVMQVFFMEIDRPLPPLPPTSFVKVRGAMKSRSRLQAFSVVCTSVEEWSAAQHVVFICDRAAHNFVTGG